MAERCLGDGRHWRAIAELNRDRTQPDGRHLTDADLIHPGWVLAIPTDLGHVNHAGLKPIHGATVITVAAGDTLWDLTAALLGPGAANADIAAAWPRLYHANQAVIGDNPDLIQPGQHLSPPEALVELAPASQPELPPAEQPPITSGGGSPAPTRTPTTARTPTTVNGGQTTAPTPPSHPAKPTAAEPSSAATAGAWPTPAPATPTTGDPSAGQPDEQDTPNQLWAVTGYGSLCALAILTALYTKRIIQQRRRRPGEHIRMPDPDDGFELITSVLADPAGADLLDRSLRSLADDAHHSGRSLPELVAVHANPAGIYLQLAQPGQPIPPFGPTTDPAWWHCPPTGALLDTDQARDVPAPYPALVTIGHTATGTQLLVDLETARELTLNGDPEQAIPVLRALAVELSAARLADELTLTLVGFGHELAHSRLAAGARIHVTDNLDEAIAELADWARNESAALVAGSHPSARHARMNWDGADAWTPHILLSAIPPDPDQAQRLAAALTAGPSTSAVAVTTGQASPTAWVIPLTGGPIAVGPTGHTVTVQQLPDAAYRQLITHLETANDPISTPAEPLSWPAGTTTAPADTDSLDLEPGDGLGDGELEMDDELDGVENLEGITPRDVRFFDPDELHHPRQGVASGVPMQRGDGDDAYETHPRIHLLGPVELLGTRGGRDPRDPIPRLTEIAAYLVLHPGASTDAIDAALWPTSTNTNTRHSYMSKLRVWLGTDNAGELYFPYGTSGSYQLHPDVRCDWLRFKRLARRGATIGGVAGAADLQSALELIRGVPFTADGRTARYGWAEPHRQAIRAGIVDAAAALADHHLAHGDWAGADQAASAGLLAVPDSEQLWRRRFTALAGSGDQEALTAAVAALDRLNEAAGLDMDQETLTLLEQLATRPTGAIA
ncbi:MAG: LysM peptidoglycan-binding domain-containing protein [Sporichthyaceae bacterium]|nr:LysM peptidoglycan-binding domain-containing protein [Sporichthyaceae bacterium]